jgi:hypothetical protein
MRHFDEQHLKHPVYGTSKVSVLLSLDNLAVNRKRVMPSVAFDGDRGASPQA